MRSDIFNEDFQDFIRVLNDCEVQYILVGAYSVILHGYARTTGDMDIWVNPTAENYQRLVKAFNQFGLPIFDMTLTKFLQTEDYDVFTFGRPPVCIEILTKVKGLFFENAYKGAEWFEIEGDLQVRALRFSDLITAKKAAGRAKDIDDIDNLQS